MQLCDYIDINKITFENSPETKEENLESVSLLKACREDKVMKKNLLIMFYLWVATSVSYYITSFNVKYMNGNMFYN